VAIPSKQLERLEADLSAHESWLATLRRQIEGLEAEASAHEMLLRLGRDRELHRILGEVHDQPELGERIAEDPRSFFEEKGIEIPDGARLTVTTDPQGFAIEARFDNPCLSYGVGWSRLDGFYLIEAPDAPEHPEVPGRQED
jgi:hypothetical protein